MIEDTLAQELMIQLVLLLICNKEEWVEIES